MVHVVSPCVPAVFPYKETIKEDPDQSTKTIPCVHSSILCKNGLSKLDEDEDLTEGGKSCPQCSQLILVEDRPRCVDECISRNCADFKELHGQYDHLFEGSEDEKVKKRDRNGNPIEHEIEAGSDSGSDYESDSE